jgi:hypothetical protein
MIVSRQSFKSWRWGNVEKKPGEKGRCSRGSGMIEDSKKRKNRKNVKGMETRKMF